MEIAGIILQGLPKAGTAEHWPGSNSPALAYRPTESLHFEDIRDHPEYRTVPGLMILCIDEELFFANASPRSLQSWPNASMIPRKESWIWLRGA